MLSRVLNNKRAVLVNIEIIRTFTQTSPTSSAVDSSRFGLTVRVSRVAASAGRGVGRKTDPTPTLPLPILCGSQPFALRLACGARAKLTAPALCFSPDADRKSFTGLMIRLQRESQTAS